MERKQIKRTGHSLCIILDKGTLANVYDVKEGDEVLVDYDFPEIIISVPKAQDRAMCPFCGEKKEKS